MMPRRSLAALAVTLAIGALAGIAAQALHLPLGYLLGPLVVTSLISVAGWRPFGLPPTLPIRLRMAFVPVIGVAIGGAFTPAVARDALTWGPSLMALCLFVPIAHGLGYAIFAKGGLSRTDAFFGAVPGGLIETVELGEQAGASVPLLIVLQFLRLIGTIIAVPILFWVLTGHPVGSAAGVGPPGSGVPLTLRDAALLVLAGLAGVALGRALRLPGWIITGPLILSALVHGAGWVAGGPPGWLIAGTQIVLGTGLGARFLGIERRLLWRGARLAAINGVAVLGLSLVFALAVHAWAGQPVTAAFLAFAPGGLAEMSLVALSLQMSTIYVTAHHVLRIVLAIALANAGARWAARR